MSGGLVSLDAIARLCPAESRSISAENPTGTRAGGAQVRLEDDPRGRSPAQRLGMGWKVRPCLLDVPSGESVVLADITGPGVVRHIWMTVRPDLLRAIALRVHYDDQSHASIECPLGDFFANGVDGTARIASIPVAVNPHGGLNCYWPMPFRRRICITITNDGPEPIPELFYQISYSLEDVPEDAGYLHASWRRSLTTREVPEHTIIDSVRGWGHYVGTYLVWSQLSNGWWGEGEVKFFIDGDPPDAPTICGTGTEDYFGGAWGFTRAGDADIRPATYSGPFLGYPQASYEPDAMSGPRVPVHGLYRWHLPDPIRFQTELRATVQALGWWPDRTFQPLTEDIASVAFWYQSLPSAPLLPLPPMEERWPR